MKICKMTQRETAGVHQRGRPCMALWHYGQAKDKREGGIVQGNDS